MLSVGVADVTLQRSSTVGSSDAYTKQAVLNVDAFSQ